MEGPKDIFQCTRFVEHLPPLLERNGGWKTNHHRVTFGEVASVHDWFRAAVSLQTNPASHIQHKSSLHQYLSSIHRYSIARSHPLSASMFRSALLLLCTAVMCPMLFFHYCICPTGFIQIHCQAIDVYRPVFRYCSLYSTVDPEERKPPCRNDK